MEKRHKPRSFFAALEAHKLAKAATIRAIQQQPNTTMAPRQYCKLHGTGITLDQSNSPRSIGLSISHDDNWLEPHQALEIADQLRSYANQSILLRAQAAVAATERNT